MSELKIACPSCGGHIEFPQSMISQVIPCPHCSLSVPLLLPGQSPAAPIRSATGKKLSGDHHILGFVIGFVGFALALSAFFACWTIIPGIGFLVWGQMLTSEHKCSECSKKVSRTAKSCAACKCTFE